MDSSQGWLCLLQQVIVILVFGSCQDVIVECPQSAFYPKEPSKGECVAIKKDWIQW